MESRQSLPEAEKKTFRFQISGCKAHPSRQEGFQNMFHESHHTWVVQNESDLRNLKHQTTHHACCKNLPGSKEKSDQS